MNEPLKLRLLASAIERLAVLENFNYAVDRVQVEWAIGRACQGYEEMSKAISEIVSFRYAEFRAAAIEIARIEVAQRRADLASFQDTSNPPQEGA